MVKATTAASQRGKVVRKCTVRGPASSPGRIWRGDRQARLPLLAPQPHPPAAPPSVLCAAVCCAV
ncbi:hypothetical protein E2C01_099145 [Portunus trituberculatus]|uniref:Uncharacterized protein n=1 Tax=Portunus trituberculatus TaxID=210409 RepID=A0A5B7KA31_PORTR|nr:hypothetical protein [Portunus trituberculatus]